MSVEEKISAASKARWSQVQDLGREVKDAGRQVLMMGLGAVDVAGEKSKGFFSDLVERGQQFEDRGRPAIEERFRKAGERFESFRHKVEHDVEARVAGTLQRFGVPDRDEVQQLIERIEMLTRKVEGMTPKAKA